MSPKARYIDSLTPLRGIAALWVVVFHYNEFLKFMGMPVLSDGTSTQLIGKAYMWVDFFFILSGFIITHVYAEKLQARRAGSVKAYLWARFTRLYPLHLFCMLLLLAFVLVLQSIAPDYYAEGWAAFFPLRDFFAYLGFGVSFGLVGNYSWNLPAWSIAAEWWAYVAAIGLIPLLGNRFAKRTITICLVALVGSNLLVAFGLRLDLDLALDLGLIRCLIGFVLGIGVYQLYRKFCESKSLLNTDWAFAAATLATLAGLHFGLHTMFVLAGFALLILCAALNSSVPAQVLNSKPLRFLGDISYSIYLLQMFWLFVWNAWIDLSWKAANPQRMPNLGELLLWLGVVLALLIASAAMTYRFVEVAGRKKLRRLFVQ